jgi:hypothetical protein
VATDQQLKDGDRDDDKPRVSVHSGKSGEGSFHRSANESIIESNVGSVTVGQEEQKLDRKNLFKDKKDDKK